ncbi:hypothetical protein [Streptomyces blattellae]|uniref:hypothetical protein n=1 Tax=Streptomyces blattellae TaxID=2569855 RepID=UPI0012B79477|nr:hypothetical protein [Streptomyces blattellae]
MIRTVIAGPELFGPRVVRATPYEGDPGRWAVLGENCAWQQQELPKDVLASLTRYFELPAAGGKGAIRLSATVTVHRTPLDAAWEQARMLEEALSCKEQLLRPGERLTELNSWGSVFGEGNNHDYDDAVGETGSCRSDTRGGPYPYYWHQVMLGPVVVSVSGCGGRGHTDADVSQPVGEAHAKVTTRVEREIGWDDGTFSGSPEAKVSPSTSVPGTKGGA